MSELLVEHYFLPEYVHKATLGGKEFSFQFANATVATLSLESSLYINGIPFAITELEGKRDIHIGYAVSEAFLPMRKRGNMVGTVAILLSNTPLKSTKELGKVRVETGRVQLANGDFNKRAEELIEERSIDSETLFDKLETGEVEGVSYTKVEETEFSYAGNFDGIEFVEIDAGYGDGTYPIIAAYDGDGKMCALYIDFLLFDRPDIGEYLAKSST